MAKIELVIAADSSQAVTEINKVGTSVQTMQDKVHRGDVRQKGLIEDTVEAIVKFEKARRKAYTIEGVEKYNKKIAEAKQTLEEYNKAGLKQAEVQDKQKKGQNELMTGLKRMAATYLTITAALKVFKAIMASTQGTADLLKREITGIKFAVDELSRSVATGNWAELGKRLSEARNAGKQYADALDNIGNRERQLPLEETERQGRMIDLAKIYRSTGLVGVEGYTKRKDAAEEYIKLAGEGEQAAIELLQIRLAAELSNARQILGLNDKYAKADKDEKARINQSIIDNVRSQKAFEQNAKAFEEYAQLRVELVRESSKRNPDDDVVKGIQNAMESFPEDIKNMRRGYIEWGEATDDVRIKVTNAYDAIGKKQNEVAQSTIRANTMAEMADAMLIKEEEKTRKERIKTIEEFTKESLSLQDEYEKSLIEGLEGQEKIDAEKDYQLKQIDLLQTHLATLGTLTEDHYKWLDGLRAKAILDASVATRKEQKATEDFWKEVYDSGLQSRMDFYDYREKLDLQAAELAGELTGKKELEIQRKWQQARIDLLKQSKEPKLQVEAEILEGEVALIDKKIAGMASEKTIWDAIGLGNNPELVDALKEGIKAATDALDEIFAARVEDAKRTRELLDTQISESQQALNAEIELAKIGLANNVDAKRKEIESLKAAREKALKDEEKALKAQRAMDAATQASSLLTATAQIIAGLTKTTPLIGLVLSVAAIASMWGMFAAARVQASKATKLAEGGYGSDTGVVTGHTHAQGGERFLDHVEVERGERWGVLNRKASAKYGRAFGEIVTSFNRDRMPVESVVADNNIIVDVNQTNDRLDKVEYQLIKLNRHFGGKREVHETADVRIEKIGNKTRIIRK